MKVALVTGASSGLGADFARELAAKKFDLIITARRKDRLEKLRIEIESEFNVKVDICVADLSTPKGVQKIINKIKKDEIEVHTLINNAGLGYQATFAEKEIEDWETLIQVNVNSLIALTNYFVKPMLARKKGAILNVASVAGFQAIPWFSVYAASKAFVLSFTEGLAKELAGSGVKISALCPGPTKTEFAQVSGSLHMKAPDLIWQSSKEVASSGLKALENNDTVYVPGALNKVQIYGQRLLPRTIVNTISSMFFKPKE